MKKVVGMGEIMIQMNPTEKGPMRYQHLFERHVAGSEGNVIIQMQRLGIQTSFITAVGLDPFGEMIISTLKSEGVDTSFVKVDPKHPTGIYFVQRSYPIPGKTKVFYYRKNSAASFISEKDIDAKIFDDVDLFFLSGITPALSKRCKKAALKAIEICVKKKIKVVFDTNIRVNLLKTKNKAFEILKPFIESAKVLFTGVGDLTFLFGKNLRESISELRKIAKNAELIIVKKGKEGSICFDVNSNTYIEYSSFPVEVEDELGAGDSFDGTFLSAMLRGYSFEKCLRYANASGAMAVSLKGDIEPLPTWKDLDLFLEVYEKSEEKLLR
ncbi:sugar kinase [Thermosipho sp. 1244]|uniref:sugar kinase n=1 Tax=Thermosipho sp. 1244 TaxID=1755816 RepID=UPI001BDF3108|nr:sugar kinase [Thermosipho sp. 1244]MBT1248271.1 hypothetical protein [Thermosipho sp. 1244]